MAGHGGAMHSLKATVFAKREFAGYWEYVLGRGALHRAGAPAWGGAALIGAGASPRHRLAPRAGEDRRRHHPGHMIVPIDILAPVLDDMVKLGRPNRPPRPC